MQPLPIHATQFGQFGGTASAYEGALASRYRTTLPVLWFDSPRTQPPQTRRRLLSNGRYVFNNVPFVAPAINELIRHTLPLRPRSLSRNREWAKRAERAFAVASRTLDITGQSRFGELQQIVMRAAFVDGDIGIVFVSDARGWPKTATFGTGWPRLQLIRSHRIGGTTNTDPVFTDGVQSNNYNEPLAYRVYKTDASLSSDFYDVPSASLRLVLRRLWPDQQRGLSLLCAGLTTIHDSKDALDFELASNKLRAGIPGIVLTDEEDPDVTQGGPFGDHATTATLYDAGGNPIPNGLAIQQQFQAGAIPHMPRGWTFQELANNRPTGNWQTFLDTLIMLGLSTTDLPPEFLYRAGKISGAFARLIIQKVNRVAHEWQKLHADQWLDDVWTFVIGSLIGAGELDADPEFMAVEWRGEQSTTIDVGREQAQDRADLFSGRRTESLDCAERGESDEEHAEQIRHEARRRVDSVVELIDYARSRGLTLSFSEAMQQIRADVQATGTAPSTRTALEPAEPEPQPRTGE